MCSGDPERSASSAAQASASFASGEPSTPTTTAPAGAGAGLVVIIVSCLRAYRLVPASPGTPQRTRDHRPGFGAGGGPRRTYLAGGSGRAGLVGVVVHEDRSEEHTSELQSRGTLVCLRRVEK